MWPNLQETFFVQCVGQKRGKISQYFFSKDTRGERHHVNFLDSFGSQTRFNVLIAIVLRLNALFITYILPENTGPHCNYKIIGGTREEGWSLPSLPPRSGDAPGIYVSSLNGRMNATSGRKFSRIFNNRNNETQKTVIKVVSALIPLEHVKHIKLKISFSTLSMLLFHM